ncbi:MAG TPA: hypothetical protein VH481_07550 [Nitrososphaeraceae archaeon]
MDLRRFIPPTYRYSPSKSNPTGTTSGCTEPSYCVEAAVAILARR